jgi:hypothetical protein
MIHRNFIIKFVAFLFLIAPCFVVNGQQSETVTYEGQLQVGKRESTIVYLGEETGDLAAFCFTNKSSIGRAILSKCKNKEQCRFSGRVDWSGILLSKAENVCGRWQSGRFFQWSIEQTRR